MASERACGSPASQRPLRFWSRQTSASATVPSLTRPATIVSPASCRTPPQRPSQTQVVAPDCCQTMRPRPVIPPLADSISNRSAVPERPRAGSATVPVIRPMCPDCVYVPVTIQGRFRGR